jgi:hypothetical protein
MNARYTLSQAFFCLIATGFLSGCSSQASDAPNASTPAAAAQLPLAPQGQRQTSIPLDATKLIADYQQQCNGSGKPTLDCEVRHDLLVAELVMSFETIELAKDQRGVPQAFAALDHLDEPELLIAACRVLGQFATTPGLAVKVLPLLLESPYIEVQRMASTLLKAVPEVGAVTLGDLWERNHGSLTATSAYSEYPEFPAHYASIGFPKYPGAKWFSPADTDRSIGWSTEDDAATVVRWFSQALHADAMDMPQWMQSQTVDVSQVFDQSKLTRMQELLPKALAGDQGATAEIDRLQKEMDQQRSNFEQSANQAVTQAVNNPPAAAVNEARWIVAKKKGNRASTVVLVYPVTGTRLTAIQLAWDLSDYPSAWGRSKS